MSDLFVGIHSYLWLKIFIPFFFVLFLGEYVPKYIGLHVSERLALSSAQTFLFLKKKMEVPLQWMTSLAENISSILFFFLKPEPPMSEKDMIEILNTSQSLGLLTRNESSLIQQVMDLKISTADDVTIPLSELPKAQKFEITSIKLLELYKNSLHRLIVITQGSSEEVIGVIDATLLKHTMKEKDLLHIIEKAKSQLSFVPKMMHVDRLLAHLDQTKATYAAVYDEHDRILGITSQKIIVTTLLPAVTLASSPHVQKDAPHDEPHIFQGTTPLDSINAFFGITLESEHDVKTIGGWLTEISDTVLPIGATYLSHGLLFRIITSDEKMISKILIQRIPLPSEPLQKEGHTL